MIPSDYELIEQGYDPPVDPIAALYARVAKLEAALVRCKTVLGNMALENEGATFNRWPISHEPLRNDARNLLPVIDAALKDKP